MSLLFGGPCPKRLCTCKGTLDSLNTAYPQRKTQSLLSERIKQAM